MSNKIKSVKVSPATKLRRMKKEAKAAIADLQCTLDDTSFQLRNSKRHLRNYIAVMKGQQKDIYELMDQQSKADRAKLDTFSAMLDKVAAADDRNKAVLGIIARVVSGEITMLNIVLILTQLGTTVPNELIEADLAATVWEIRTLRTSELTPRRKVRY